MAAADFTAIEYVLDREVDVDTLRLAGNFDAVAKGRHGAARPARSTVLRDVLVPAHGAVVDTIFIAPGASCSLVHTQFRRRAPSARTRKRGANSCCVEESSCAIATANTMSFICIMIDQRCVSDLLSNQGFYMENSRSHP